MSKNFTKKVLETRTYLCEYIVEAKDDNEAEEKAMIGETVSESELKLEAVVDREIVDN